MAITFEHPVIAALQTQEPPPGLPPPRRGEPTLFYDCTAPQNMEAVQRAVQEGLGVDGMLQYIVEANGGGGPEGESTGGAAAQPLAGSICTCSWYPAWWIYRNMRCAMHGL